MRNFNDYFPEQETKDLTLAMELFTSDPLDAFDQETNVDIHTRIVSYNIRDLGRQLKALGLLTITDSYAEPCCGQLKKRQMYPPVY